MDYKKVIKYFRKDLYNRILYDDITYTGAQISYFLLMSLFPFLIFLISVLSYTQLADIRNNYDLISKFIPSSSFQIVKDIIDMAVQKRSITMLGLSLAATFWFSSSAVVSLIKGINKAYNQEETRTIPKLIGVSIIFITALAIVIICSLALIVFAEFLEKFLFQTLGSKKIFNLLWNNFRYILMLTISVVTFIFLYSYIPNHKQKYRSVVPGAIFATLGWIVTSILFSYYANNFSNYSRLYGSLGGIIALLVWLYLFSIVILGGAQINSSIKFYKEGKLRERPKLY